MRRTAIKRSFYGRAAVPLGAAGDSSVSPDECLQSAPDDAFQAVGVVRELAALSPAQRVAIQLRMEGLCLHEIASELNWSLSTLKRRLAAAQARLLLRRSRGSCQ